MIFTNEQKKWIKDEYIEPDYRLIWDDESQLLIIKDPDGFHPNVCCSYSDLARILRLAGKGPISK